MAANNQPVDPSEFVEDVEEEDDDLPVLMSAKQVKLASGVDYEVMHETEVSMVENLVKRYTTEYLFNSISDLQDVDRIIVMELMAHRYSVW